MSKEIDNPIEVLASLPKEFNVQLNLDKFSGLLERGLCLDKGMSLDSKDSPVQYYIFENQGTYYKIIIPSKDDQRVNYPRWIPDYSNIRLFIVERKEIPTTKVIYE